MVSGLTWKSYAESLPSMGYTGYNTGSYVKRHNPFAYFTDVANSSERMNIVSTSRLLTDASSGQLPNLAFVIPNLAHDGHDASLLVTDAWLRLYIKPILESPAFQPGGDGLLIIAFDESYNSDCRPKKNCTRGSTPFGGHVATIFAGPGAKSATKSSLRYYHENLLSTICYALGTSCPGKGATAAPMKDMLK
jgi:acid phosphatase